MPYDLYWHGPLDAYYIYAEKARAEDDREFDRMNREAHLNGKYFQDALLSVYHMFNGMIDSGRATKYKYPVQPYKKRVEHTEEEIERGKKAVEMIREHNARINKMLKGGDQGERTDD